MDNRLRRALDLQVRDDPTQLTTRSMQLRAQTIDDDQRSVEATIATDRPVEVWDWERRATVDEVLLIDGARLPSQLPMLANTGSSTNAFTR